MSIKKYRIGRGPYEGKWHVRIYISKGKYFHVGRFQTEEEADEAIRKYEAQNG